MFAPVNAECLFVSPFLIGIEKDDAQPMRFCAHWEVIATSKSLDRDFDRLRTAYHWLTEPQLRAALGYYAAYPEEIDRQIALNQSWTKERLAARYPSLVPEQR